jgi:hypothetical protein
MQQSNYVKLAEHSVLPNTRQSTIMHTNEHKDIENCLFCGWNDENNALTKKSSELPGDNKDQSLDTVIDNDNLSAPHSYDRSYDVNQSSRSQVKRSYDRGNFAPRSEYGSRYESSAGKKSGQSTGLDCIGLERVGSNPFDSDPFDSNANRTRNEQKNRCIGICSCITDKQKSDHIVMEINNHHLEGSQQNYQNDMTLNSVNQPAQQNQRTQNDDTCTKLLCKYFWIVCCLISYTFVLILFAFLITNRLEIDVRFGSSNTSFGSLAHISLNNITNQFNSSTLVVIDSM